MVTSPHTHHIDYQYLANGLRVLVADMVENANSGHLGMPLGMADVVTVLYHNFIRFNPQDPEWPIRDRFILSAGHGSALLYAVLFLTGYTHWHIEDLKHFRQLHAKAAGHPEKNHKLGIETTTGPLGQGLANAVGLALAGKILAAQTGHKSLEYTVYVIVGDGCMMEGISHESMSLAGKLQLNNLVVLFDDNGISIDGEVAQVTCEDHITCVQAKGWQAYQVDGHNHLKIFNTIQNAILQAPHTQKPVFIACKTNIGHGAIKKAGSSAAHGGPLGQDEMTMLRQHLNWNHDAFTFPAQFLQQWRYAHKSHTTRYRESINLLENTGIGRAFKTDYISQYWNEISNQLLLVQENEEIISLSSESTRKSLQRAISKTYHIMHSQYTRNIHAPEATTTNTLTTAITPDDISPTSATTPDFNKCVIPLLLGGSADLTPSNCTKSTVQQDINSSQYLDFTGNYLHYGVREHAMAAIMNGLSLSCVIKPYGGTFLAFVDYCIPAVRLAAMMQLPVIFICTHDSIGVGEDGATHQPIEHLSYLRSMPNLMVYRPCDAVETSECWALALQSQNAPSIIALSRQDIKQLRTQVENFSKNDTKYTTINHESKLHINFSSRGAYILHTFVCTTTMNLTEYDIAIYSCGSEMEIAIEAAQRIQNEFCLSCAVISVPSITLFFQQHEKYIEKIMHIAKIRLIIEAGLKQSWSEFLDFDTAGRCINFVGLETYGLSASADQLYKHYQITANKVIQILTENYHIKNTSTAKKNML